MLANLRSNLTYANVMATIAVFVALGGSSYAALRVGSKQIVNNSIRSKDIRNNTVRSRDVRDGSLLALDFRQGSLPAGRPGPRGPRGPRGVRTIQRSSSQVATCSTEGCVAASVATCSTGEQVTGGGFLSSSHDVVREFRRQGAGWLVRVQDDNTDSDSSASARARVICASP